MVAALRGIRFDTPRLEPLEADADSLNAAVSNFRQSLAERAVERLVNGNDKSFSELDKLMLRMIVVQGYSIEEVAKDFQMNVEELAGRAARLLERFRAKGGLINLS